MKGVAPPHAKLRSVTVVSRGFDKLVILYDDSNQTRYVAAKDTSV